MERIVELDLNDEGIDNEGLDEGQVDDAEAKANEAAGGGQAVDRGIGSREKYRIPVKLF